MTHDDSSSWKSCKQIGASCTILQKITLLHVCVKKIDERFGDVDNFVAVT